MTQRKLSKKERLKAATDQHESWLSSRGLSDSQLKTKLGNKYGRRIGINDLPDLSVKSNLPHTSGKVCENGAQKPTSVYTGVEIMGIGLMHKSNYVPVRRDHKQSAIDLATMRRN